jgi:glyoxylase-like metal-dependent hydrolase (beta-lactamase superfamily II)
MSASRNALFRRLAAALAVTVLAAGCTRLAGEPKGAVERMYVFNCGEAQVKDLSRWSPGVNVGKAGEFSDNCYLLRHAKGLMLWDSGYADAVAAMKDGAVGGGGAIVGRLPKTLVSQLAGIGVAPNQITHVAFSHTHSDHVGNANLFTAGTLYIQEPEYEAAFGPDAAKFNFAPANYDKLRASRVVKLTGDHDVFGDGSVVILSTPGHTPGHQSLLVRLPNRGAVVLSGDLAHFEENWVNRRVPAFNFSREQSLQSMEKVAAVLSANHAELWINHDKAQSARVPKAPAYVE